MRTFVLLPAFLAAALAYGTGCSGGGGGNGGGGAGGTGGNGGTATGSGDLVNGCDAATAEDHTADSMLTISESGLAYDPPCVRIKTGTSVTFSSDFVSHPLVGGQVVDGEKTPDDSTPITTTETGTEATFTFPDAGTFGFYCNVHGTVGMKGAIFVE